MSSHFRKQGGVCAPDPCSFCTAPQVVSEMAGCSALTRTPASACACAAAPSSGTWPPVVLPAGGYSSHLPAPAPHSVCTCASQVVKLCCANSFSTVHRKSDLWPCHKDPFLPVAASWAGAVVWFPFQWVRTTSHPLRKQYEHLYFLSIGPEIKTKGMRAHE